MLFVSQIRAARGLLGWNQTKLATMAGLALSTIKRMESGDALIKGNATNVWKIQCALEEAGIEFIDENGGGVGVRLKSRSTDLRS